MSSAQFQAPQQFTVTVTTAGTPVQLSATSLFVRAAVFQSQYSNTPGTVMLLGSSSANAAASKAYSLQIGEEFSLSGSTMNSRDVQYDLSDFWVNSTVSGTTLVVMYMKELLHT